MKKHFIKDFVEFIQDQGVIGIAIAFVLGAAVTRLVTAFIADFVNPILKVVLGAAGGLSKAEIRFWGMVFPYGNFISSLIDFFVVALIVYGFYRLLRLEKLIKKKE